MGQKVHPTGIRLGIVKDHNSVWYAGSKQYAKQLVTDLQVREYLEEKLSHASVSRIVIERPAQTARVTIHTARPGIVIGKKAKMLRSCAKSSAIVCQCPCTSTSKKFASRIWMPSWLQ